MAIPKFIRRFLRRFKSEPSSCKNCGAMSFEKTYRSHDLRDPWWVCESCKYRHGVSFGGTWICRSPEDEPLNQTFK